MTERPMGDGWWLASDGRWYPPESRPAPPAPPPPPQIYPLPTELAAPLGDDEQPRYLSFGLTGTVSAFLWGTAAASVMAGLLLVVYWFTWSAHVDRGTPRTLSDLLTAEDVVAVGIGVAWFTALVTGVLFLIWFFQAYQAAVDRGATGRTWGAGWTIGAWFIPLANLVIPKLVMNEVDRMSNPRVPEPTGGRWRSVGRHPLNDLWWTCLVMAVVVQAVAGSVLDSFSLGQDGYGSGILISIVAAVLFAAAAAMAGGLVLLIGRRLREVP